MIIDCISDLHGHYPQLEGGDLLIVAGDLTARDLVEEYWDFFDWIVEQKYKKMIYIAGNHDNFLQNNPPISMHPSEGMLTYLCDSGTEFEGLKIWGSPWTAYFEGMNPDCTAFTINAGCDTDDWLAEKWALIPEDTDILITHSPPASILDDVENYVEGQIENVGSFQLIHYLTIIQPKLHVFGHIHEGFGKATRENLQIINNLFPNTTFVNASHVNEHYKPVNKSIRIEL
jgi:Icc-related predicted phosphoesterase